MALSRLHVCSKIKFYQKLIVGSDVKFYFLRVMSDRSDRYGLGSLNEDYYSRRRSNSSNDNTLKHLRSSGNKSFNKSSDSPDANDSMSSSRYNDDRGRASLPERQKRTKNVNTEAQVETIKSNLRILHNLSESSLVKSKNTDRYSSSSAASTHRDDIVEKLSATGNDFWSPFVESDVSAADGEMLDYGDNQIVDEKRRMAELAFIKSLKNSNPQKKVVPQDVTYTAYGQIRRDESSREPMKMDRRSRNAQQMSVDVSQNTEEELEWKFERSRSDRNEVSRAKSKRLNESRTSGANLFEDQYFGLSTNEINDSANAIADSKSVTSTKDSKTNFIEEQYFSSNVESNQKSIFDVASDIQLDQQSIQSASFQDFKVHGKAIVTDEASEDVNFFDKSYFSEVSRSEKQLPRASAENSDRVVCSIFQDNFSYDEKDFDLDNFFLKSTNQSKDDNNTLKVETATRGELKRMKNQPADTENPKTAYDAVVKLRRENKEKIMNEKKQILTGEKKVITTGPGKWDGHVDSKGFRILTSQVKDLEHMIDVDLVSMLCDSILFENEQLMVLNKPYGLPSHGGPGIHKSIASLLDKMVERRERKIRKYHLVHRLDRDTTGVMLLAKSEQVADLLMTRFENRKVIKTYWALTKGIPEPLEGIINIPIGEGSIDAPNGKGYLEKKYRMELRPNYPKRMRLLKNSVDQNGVSEAITHYKVLESNNSCALVECKPETGVKHQIRCHLAFALNTPILGDHKYSHMSRLAPQKLPSEMLQKLGIRQTKVRHVPMHLHARSLVLPEFLPDGRNLFASARLPGHFIQNMKWLKLKIP